MHFFSPTLRKHYDLNITAGAPSAFYAADFFALLNKTPINNRPKTINPTEINSA